MENSPYKKLYNYSKKYLSHKQRFVQYAITFGSNALLAIVIFLLIDLSNTYVNKIPLYITILIILTVSTFL
ncbi:MAG: hypothetical protein Q7K55_07235, partial [Candidatus Levybacteria bacterium]|nr:hypothetical protein [Candidatus Levybacteria bacterium]